MKKVLITNGLKDLFREKNSLFDRAEIVVLAAATNDEMLKICREEKIDLIFTQLDLPGLRSEEFFRIIRKSNELKGLSTIICCDEEDNIRDALESVTWCDEIVVVDSFSRDRTLDICREYTDRIYQRPWPGFVEQKAFALAQARHPWVLNLDADERVSPELRREVEEVLRQPRADGFYVPRLVYYLGRWWRRGDWYPDYRLRLFRRDKVVWGGVDPHEKVILRGRSARLHGPLWHYTYRDIGDHLATINRFTGVAARELLLRRRQASVADLLLRPFWRFLRFYALRGGFTQGLAGLFVAQSASFYVFAKYAKLWEATHVRPPGPGGDTGPSPS